VLDGLNLTTQLQPKKTASQSKRSKARKTNSIEMEDIFKKLMNPKIELHFL
jgi:hypothetical protein